MEWNDEKFSGTKLSLTIWTSFYFCGWIVFLCYLQTIFATEIQNRFCSLLKLVHKNNKIWTYAVLTLVNMTNFQSFFHPKWPIILNFSAYGSNECKHFYFILTRNCNDAKPATDSTRSHVLLTVQVVITVRRTSCKANRAELKSVSNGKNSNEAI